MSKLALMLHQIVKVFCTILRDIYLFFYLLCEFVKVLQVYQGIKVTQVPLESVWKALQALLGYQDPQAERVPQQIPTLPGLVPQAHLAGLGLWDRKAFKEIPEAQGLQVSFKYM